MTGSDAAGRGTAGRTPGKVDLAMGQLVAAVCVSLVLAVVGLLVLWMVWPRHVELLPDSWLCSSGYEIRAAYDGWSPAAGAGYFDSFWRCVAPDGGVEHPGGWALAWREVLIVGLPLTLLIWRSFWRSSQRAGTAAAGGAHRPAGRAAGQGLHRSTAPVTARTHRAPASRSFGQLTRQLIASVPPEQRGLVTLGDLIAGQGPARVGHHRAVAAGDPARPSVPGPAAPPPSAAPSPGRPPTDVPAPARRDGAPRPAGRRERSWATGPQEDLWGRR